MDNVFLSLAHGHSFNDKRAFPIMVQQPSFCPWNPTIPATSFLSTATSTSPPEQTSPTSFHQPAQISVTSPQSSTVACSNMQSVLSPQTNQQLHHQYQLHRQQHFLQLQQQQQRLSSFQIVPSSNALTPPGGFISASSTNTFIPSSVKSDSNNVGDFTPPVSNSKHRTKTNSPIDSIPSSDNIPLSPPLPTLPEEILIKIDPSLGDPTPPPHADISIAKPYQCDQCLKRYSGMKSLKNHKLTHSTARPHKCSICGKAFLRADKMRLHEISHLNTKPFECTTCKQRFTRSDKLKIHHRTHTGVRPYGCSFCPKRFTRSDKLKIHERIHTKVKPYECTHCGKCFARSDKRRLHERIHLYGPRPKRPSGATRKSKRPALATLAPTQNVSSFVLAMESLTSSAAGTGATDAVFSTAFGLANAASFVNPLGLQPHQLAVCGYLDGTKKLSSSSTNYLAHNGNSAQQAFAFNIPASQTVQFSPQQQQHHQSTLASLAGIAQYHPALFAAQQQQQQQRQLTPISTASFTVPFYQQQQQQQPMSSQQSSVYPQTNPMFPFLMGSSNSLAPFIQHSNNSAFATVTCPQTSVDRGNTTSSTDNITAVMAAAVFGHQFRPGAHYAASSNTQSAFVQPAHSQLLSVEKPDGRSGFRLYNPNSNSTMHAQQQSQQQVIQLQQHLQRQQQHQQLMQQHSTMLHQQQKTNHNTGLIGLFPQAAAAAAAAHFIPSVVSQNYAHSQQQQYLQVEPPAQQQQQQSYLTDPTAFTPNSNAPDTTTSPGFTLQNNLTQISTS